jgi:hypothetical protein
MKHNMSVIDRALRVGLAAVFLSFYFKNNVSGVPGILLVVISIIFTFTAFVNFSPVYYFLGIKRWERRDQKN